MLSLALILGIFFDDEVVELEETACEHAAETAKFSRHDKCISR